MKVVLFDLDHTLVRCNLSYEFGRFLFHQKYFSIWSVCLLVLTYALQWIGLLSTKNMHRISFSLLFRRKKGGQVEDLARQFIEIYLVRFLRPSLLVELERAKEEENFILLFSSSPAFLVKCVAQKLGIEYWLGSEYEENNQGDLVRLKTVVDGRKKLEVLQQFLEQQQGALSHVTAYSDSFADLPLLEAVGHPVVVAPNHRLEEFAGRHGWDIMPL